MPIQAVRFSAGDASAEEQAELADELAALDGTKILESGEGGGAPLADVLIIALIDVGAPILYDAVKVFGKWLLGRKSRAGRATDESVRVTVEGLRGSCTITITSETDEEPPDLAGVGTVTEIREAT